MPESAYSALLRAGNALPVSVVPNQAFEVVLHVTNTSDVPWDRSEFGAMRIGNHWLSTMGTMLIQDDGRALIPLLVQPSDTFMVRLTVTSPRRAGQYLCEFDLVHEGVSWFADKNSVTLRQHVTVGTEQDAGGHGTLPFTSSDVGTFPDIYHDLRHDASEIENFPMFGVLHETALDLISRCGGALFHVEEDERCAGEWVGFSYMLARYSRR